MSHEAALRAAVPEDVAELMGQLSAADAGYAGLLGAMELWSGVGRAAAEGGSRARSRTRKHLLRARVGVHASVNRG